jgi:hypothetical protein
VNDLPKDGLEAVLGRCKGCGRSLAYTEEENTQRIYSEIQTAGRRRYIPGFCYGAVFFFLIGAFIWRPYVRQVVGWDTEWTFLRVVLMILWFFGMMLSNLFISITSVSLLYTWLTGRMYVEDRVAYARAGALDLSHFMPLVSPAIVYLYYFANLRGIIHGPLPDAFKGPMAFWGVTLGVTAVICLVLSVILFKIMRPKFRRRSL